jgi:hypothetical protein
MRAKITITQQRTPFLFSQAITSPRMNLRLRPMKTHGAPAAWSLSMLLKLHESSIARSLRVSSMRWLPRPNSLDSWIVRRRLLELIDDTRRRTRMVVWLLGLLSGDFTPLKMSKISHVSIGD